MGRAVPAANRRASDRWRLALAVTVFCGVVAAALDGFGAAARIEGPSVVAGGDRQTPVVVVAGAGDAVRAWNARGLRGRRIIHLGRFLHFVGDSGAVRETLVAPGTGAALDRQLLATAGARDHLWVAAELRIAREVVFVPPPASLQARLRAVGREGDAPPLTIDDAGHARELRNDLPSDDTAIVDVHASWFEDGLPDALLDQLRAAGVRTDLVTVTLAFDADDVGAEARERAHAFAAALAGPQVEALP